jgi:hypothetical protein
MLHSVAALVAPTRVFSKVEAGERNLNPASPDEVRLGRVFPLIGIEALALARPSGDRGAER